MTFLLVTSSPDEARRYELSQTSSALLFAGQSKDSGVDVDYQAFDRLQVRGLYDAYIMR